MPIFDEKGPNGRKGPMVEEAQQYEKDKKKREL